MYSIYCTNQIHSIKQVQISKMYLQHISGQMYHIQGVQNMCIDKRWTLMLSVVNFMYKYIYVLQSNVRYLISR